MNKAFRHGQILRIIRDHSVYTQEELAAELRKIGVEATQVTLSRDIRELGVVKTGEGYRQIAVETAGPDFATIAGEFLMDVRIAQNQLVLKTPPGHASTLAVALDAQGWPEVVGTLAGDDTVLVIAPDPATAEQLRRRLFDYAR